MSSILKAFDLVGKIDPDFGLLIETELGADWETQLAAEVEAVKGALSFADETSMLVHVSQFLDAEQMKRLFQGSDSADVAKALGLSPSRNEVTNCRNIEAYFKGQAK